MKPCIEARGCVNGSGYVQVYVADLGKRYPKGLGAHVYAWICSNGLVPAGMCVCHHCDNRRCIEPSHLFLGTVGDNMRDMRAKGRGYTVPTHLKARGEARPEARLTEAWVRAARAMRNEAGLTWKAIGAELGVHKMTARDAVIGKTWAHVR